MRDSLHPILPRPTACNRRGDGMRGAGTSPRERWVKAACLLAMGLGVTLTTPVQARPMVRESLPPAITAPATPPVPLMVLELPPATQPATQPATPATTQPEDAAATQPAYVPPPPSPEQVRASEIATLLEVVRQPAVPMDLRRKAALSLLTRRWPQADEALLAAFTQDKDATTQQAIAQALATAPIIPPPPFAQAMAVLLGRAEEPLLGDVAAALARSDDGKTLQSLGAAVLDAQAPLKLRRGAIMVLAGRHHQTDAAILMAALSLDQPGGLRDAAAAALAQMTGISAYQGDPDQWLTWWQEASRLPEPLWRDHLFANHSRARASATRLMQQTQAKLVETHIRLYRALPAEDQQPLLTQMLADNLEPMRLAAMDLIEQRFSGQQPIGDELRKALRGVMDDASVPLRVRAVQQLRNLADDAAADRVAEVLAQPELRPGPDLMRAYLLMLARLPRPTALPRILQALGDPAVSDAAAEAIARALASNDQALDAQQTSQVRETLRKTLRDDQPPSPQVVTLLGRLAEESDWTRIAQWLDSREAPVKVAAAGAWARSERELLPLAMRADDPVILPILLDAAARRGQEDKVYARLIAITPRQEQVADWHRAILAMTPRVHPAAVLKAEAVLAERNDPIVFREQIITAAINPLLREPATLPTTHPVGEGHAGAEDQAMLVELLLTRAALRSADSDPNQALEDYARLSQYQLKLTPEQARRRDMGLLAGRLALTQWESLPDLSASLLTGTETQPAQPAQVVGLYLKEAGVRLETQQLERARELLLALRAMTLPALPEAIVSVRQRLEEQAGMTSMELPPPTQPASQPATQPVTQPDNSVSPAPVPLVPPATQDQG